MNFWTAILTLTVVEIMNLMIHMLLPEGNLRKYASFVMGILVVYTLLGPLVQGIGLLDEKIADLHMDTAVAGYEQIDVQDYVSWYLGQGSLPQE